MPTGLANQLGDPTDEALDGTGDTRVTADRIARRARGIVVRAGAPREPTSASNSELRDV